MRTRSPKEPLLALLGPLALIALLGLSPVLLVLLRGLLVCVVGRLLVLVLRLPLLLLLLVVVCVDYTATMEPAKTGYSTNRTLVELDTMTCTSLACIRAGQTALGPSL